MIVQNKTWVTVIDSWTVDGVVQGFLGGTVLMEVTDPNGLRLSPDVSASFTDVNNVAAQATFQVTIPSIQVNYGDDGSPYYKTVKPPYVVQFKVTKADGKPQYFVSHGIHVTPNIDG